MIYDISRGGMQPGELENRRLWLNGDRRILAAARQVWLPSARNLHSIAAALSPAG